MRTVIRVKLNETRAKRPAQRARKESKTKSEVLRQLIGERVKIKTGEDLSAFVEKHWGKGFGRVSGAPAR